MVELNVIGGFLGAGKTTTVRHLLGQLPAGERVAVVVNDFGEAEIDAAILSEDGHTLRAIPGSCVCCTAPEGFAATVRDLLDQVDRILVEPTGLARASDLVDTLRRAPYADKLSLGPLVVVVDPHLLASELLPHDAQDQVELADVVVLNRTDLAAPDELARARRRLEQLWPGPLRRIETERGQVPLDALSWPEGAGPRARPGHEHHHHHSEAFVSVSQVWPPETIFHRGRLLEALRAAPAAIVRFKGLLRTDEGMLRLDLAGGQISSAPTGWRRDSRFDLVGADAQALQTVQAALQGALLRPEERPGAREALELAWPGGSRLFDRAALQALPDGIEDVSALVPGRAGRAARVSELLKQASGGAEAVVVAQDGYTTPPTPLPELQDAVLVHSLGDGPLPASQGGPFRLLIPQSSSACANVKGVVRLAVR
jgi:G3E family GTPase